MASTAKQKIVLGVFAVCSIGMAWAANAEPAQRRSIKIAAFGTLTGPVKSFGVNSRAALQAAAQTIDAAGGIKLKDGSIGYFDVTYADDHCKPDDAIGIIRQLRHPTPSLALGRVVHP
jgi:ABC-type branched-subunit amino acid transport system substrate-binding protein